MIFSLLLCGLIGLLSTTAAMAQSAFSLFEDDKSAWTGFLSGGYDTYVQTFPLATSDTTETISDYTLTCGLNGRSARNATHGWYLRSELSFGTELYREHIDGEYQYRPDGRTARAHLRASWLGRQYRDDSQYSLTSNTHEARAEARWSPPVLSAARTEIQAKTSQIRYAEPSELELDYDDTALRLRLRSPRMASRRWELGVRTIERAYPDSSNIDRRIYGVHADCDLGDNDRVGLMIYQRSDRRLIANSLIRPDAWTHWTDIYGSAPAGAGQVVLELQSELWRYDQEQSVYIDSWRRDGYLAYRWGDLLSAIWRVGLSVEDLDAGDNPESYTQAGIRGGVETYGTQFSGSLTLEYGYRRYDQVATLSDLDDLDDSQDFTDYSAYLATYSDFRYVEIWLMASWFATTHLSLEIMANYQPESHTERTDDSSVAFGSFRLVWRP